MTIDWNVIITVIVAGAGVLVSFFTFYYQRKQYRFNTLLEVLKLLNDEKHRRARQVVYRFKERGKAAEERKILLDLGFPEEIPTDIDGIIEESRTMVRNDFNQIGSLIKNKLLQKKEFMHTYWYTVLLSWDSLQGMINEKQKIRENPNYMADFKYLKGEANEYRQRKGFTFSP